MALSILPILESSTGLIGGNLPVEGCPADCEPRSYGGWFLASAGSMLGFMEVGTGLRAIGPALIPISLNRVCPGMRGFSLTGLESVCGVDVYTADEVL